MNNEYDFYTISYQCERKGAFNKASKGENWDGRYEVDKCFDGYRAYGTYYPTTYPKFIYKGTVAFYNIPEREIAEEHLNRLNATYGTDKDPKPFVLKYIVRD